MRVVSTHHSFGDQATQPASPSVVNLVLVVGFQENRDAKRQHCTGNGQTQGQQEGIAYNNEHNDLQYTSDFQNDS